ncbi:kyphoscoliosis peptidase [Ephemerocybe angulata]|uniref:Kyphoscoliosis peptidase n=1 Tax=Ephemerocybe angulata TaxID=980116 RepID=A0A8H6IEH8_9AGAR|nr:kyphoscoliosis peptidase [Tulosesus angulatus]
MSRPPPPPRRAVPTPPPRRPVPAEPSDEKRDASGIKNGISPARAVPPIPLRKPSDSSSVSSVTEREGTNTIDKSRLLARKPPPRPVPPLPRRLPSLNEAIPPSLKEILPVPPPPPRPPLPSRKRTEDAPQIDRAASPQTPPEVPGRRRLPPPLVRGSTPPPPPPVKLSTKPVLETPSTDGVCIKCYDFSAVDHHASLFPKHNIQSLATLARDLTEPFQSETEKARAIYTWLSHNIIYDVQAFFSGNLQHATPESTVRSGLAVCDGYAGLFMHLAKLAGIRQVSKVTGHGKGFGYAPLQPGQPLPPPELNHAWNRICLDDEWRLIDACWGAGNLNGSVWDQRLNPYWFTADATEFGKQHYPMDDPKNQLLTGRPCTWQEYIAEPLRPMIYGDFYNLNFDIYSLEPALDGLRTGGRLSFRIAKRCLHMSTAEEDNYVAFLYTNDQARTPLVADGSGGWSATVYVPPGSDVTLYYVKTVEDRDGKGLTVEEFQWMYGRRAMGTGGLAKWNAA